MTPETNDAPYDLCIVGAGPAGLSLAAELATSGLSICVVESGGEKRTEVTEQLKRVRSTKLGIREDSRVRVFGGAGTVWGGLSAPLDDIDFKPREWTAGWPLSRAELVPYLERARRYHFPSLTEFSAEGRLRGRPLQAIREKLFVAVRPVFNFAQLKSFLHRRGVAVLTDTTLISFQKESKEGITHVQEALCRRADGEEVHIRARIFVLAAGGIENPRVLLASGIGNAYDQVGRYFMNHPKGYAGSLRLKRPLSAESLYLPRVVDGHIAYAGLTLTEDVQEHEGLLNSYVQCEVDLGPLQRYAYGIWRRLPSGLAPLFNLLRPRTLRLRWYADMEPRAENRVTLSNEDDAFGVPLPVVTYTLGPRDIRTLEKLHRTLSRAVSASGLGHIEGTAEEVIAAVTQDASHHLGATRMGDSPEHSVVDADLKVYSTDNLFVIGGSVFPTSGCANPTMTIVALSLRLAEHLYGVLSAHARAHEHGAATAMVIGAGKRVREDVLPALETSCIAVHGIYARSPGVLFGMRQAYAIRPISELGSDSSRTDIIYIAVPPQEVESVVRMVYERVGSAPALVIDTPAPTDEGAREILARFGRVYVAEDSAHLPWLPLVVENSRGALVRVQLDRSAYRYHALALLRACARGASIAWMLHIGHTVRGRVGNVRFSIQEPRNYARGTMRFFYSDRSVVSDASKSGKDALTLVRKGSYCLGFALGERHISLGLAESRLIGPIGPQDTIVTKMLELKRIGLARMLRDIAEGSGEMNLAATTEDAAADACVRRRLAPLYRS